jgi:GntR family transcriptional regulator, transcriptional repressor for pyruvate dehydrogenase complex
VCSIGSVEFALEQGYAFDLYGAIDGDSPAPTRFVFTKGKCMVGDSKSSRFIYEPGYEIVAKKINQFIMTSGLRPGDRLPTELHFAEQLGVSRSMVREAMKLLVARGLVRTRRRSGAYVGNGNDRIANAAIDLSMPIDLEHILALFDFRCIQETATAKMAAELITPREIHALEETLMLNQQNAKTGNVEAFLESDSAFHQKIAEASRNPFLIETVATTFRLQHWAIKIITGDEPDSLRISAEQHHIILQAIKDGKSEDAVAAMVAHIQRVKKVYQSEVRRLLAAYIDKT